MPTNYDEYYQGQYTGPQIDEALGRVLRNEVGGPKGDTGLEALMCYITGATSAPVVGETLLATDFNRTPEYGEKGQGTVTGENIAYWITYVVSKNSLSYIIVDSATDLRGRDGKDGEDGKDGVDGTVSFEELTEVQIEMLRGPEGPVGPAGPIGTQGEKGQDGTVGFDELTDAQKEELAQYVDVGTSLPVEVEAISTICDHVELSDSKPDITFSSPITLNEDSKYYLEFVRNYDGTYTRKNSGYLFSEVETGESGKFVRWGSVSPDNSVTLSENGVQATWRPSGTLALCTIKEVKITVTNDMDFVAVNQQGYNNVASGTYAYAEGEGTRAKGIYSHAEGRETEASGNYSHAEGWDTHATAMNAHAEGGGTKASNQYAHAEGGQTVANGGYSHAEGRYTTASGIYSHAEGEYTEASGGFGTHAEGSHTIATGDACHAEGSTTIAAGYRSHAEGYLSQTTSSAEQAHAEGYQTTASGDSSHAEGYKTVAKGMYDHAEGYDTVTTGPGAHSEGYTTEAFGIGSHSEGSWTSAYADYSHAEGDHTTANGECAHAEGSYTTASGDNSHAEGYSSTASNTDSHAEGAYTTASAPYAHAEGWYTKASAAASHAGGRGTIASGYIQTVIGRYNVEYASSSANEPNQNAIFIVGKGDNDSARANAFRVSYTGTYASGSYNGNGADYAEMFEWEDGNPKNEDRRGLLVTLDGEKIKLATPNDDFILGVVSGSPSVVGDVYDDQWKGMYMYDVFGTPIWEDVEVEAEYAEYHDPENPGETIKQIVREAHIEHRQKLNPEYNNEEKYIPRSERPEWDVVGMLGKLVMVDDGTCKPNGYCTVGANGKATYTDEYTPYRVMSRLDDTHIKVLIL